MKPAKFSFVQAQSFEQVFALFKEYGDDAKIIAGGQSLLPTLNMRLSAPRLLIDISRLDALHGIRLEGDKLVIGALTRHVDLQSSTLVADHLPLLSTAIEHVAHAAIRNRGTIGGNLSLADPASELPACCLALNAEFTILNDEGQRQVCARDYFIDLYETALQSGDLLTAISFPLATDKSIHGFREFVRRRGDFASAGVVVQAEMVEDHFTRIAAVFFAISNTPLLAEKTAALLSGKTLNTALIESALEQLPAELDIIGDLHTSADMKRHLCTHYFREILQEMGNGC